MSIGSWLGLLGLIAVPIVVLIYLIKSKYVPKTVSSTFIWQRSLKYMKRRVPINFIMSLLLIMQLLVVATASLALLNIRVQPRESYTKIIIVDASSSMNAKSGTSDKTRYEVAIEKVAEYAKDVDTNKGLVVIFAGDTPELLTRGTSPIEEDGEAEETPCVYTKKEALEAVNDLKNRKCAEGDVSIDAALTLARDCEAIDKNKNSIIYVLTDKDFNEPPKDEIDFEVDNSKLKFRIDHCNDAQKEWNVGITNVEEKYLASGYQFEVTVSSQGGTGYIYKEVYLGHNRLKVTEKMLENGKVSYTFMPPKSNYINPTSRYIIQLNGDGTPCSIVNYDKFVSEDKKDAEKVGTIQLPTDRFDEDGKSKYPNGFTVEIDLTGYAPGEYDLTIVEQAERREPKNDTDDEKEACNREYALDKENEEDVEFAPSTFYLHLYVDGRVVTSQEVTISWPGKDNHRDKKFIFTSKTGDVSDEAREFFIIKPIMEYKKARFVLATEGADVISEDNESYLGSVPNVETKILYVSNNVKIKNGAPDLTKRSTLQIALTAVGYQIQSEDIYHSSSVKRAPTSGYTLYIYEGVVPPIIPTDGTVWFLNVPKSDADKLGLKISLEKDAIAEHSTVGYRIEKAKNVTDENSTVVNQILQKIKFEPLTVPGQTIIPVTSRFGVIGEVKDRKNPETGEIEKYIETENAIPKGFETVYDAIFYYRAPGSMSDKEMQTPIMMAGDLNGTTKSIITTFDFSDSSLPVFISDFPILIKNMVEYSLPEILTERTYPVGGTLEFNKPNGAESIKISYVPNMTLYDAYVNLYEGFNKAYILAKRGKDIDAIDALEKAIDGAVDSIENYPVDIVRSELTRDDGMWLVEKKLQDRLEFYTNKYKDIVNKLAEGKDPVPGQSIKKIQVASWTSSSLSSIEDDGKLPDVILDKFGTYDITVTFKASENLSNPQAPVVQSTETYTVTTFLPTSECNIVKRGEALTTDIGYLGGATEIQEEVVKNPIMPWVVLVLVVLLIIEWGVYYRDEY